MSDLRAAQVDEFMGWLFRDGGLEPPRQEYDAVEQRLRLLVNPPDDPTVCEVCGALADGEPGRCHRHFRAGRTAEPAPKIDTERLARAIDVVEEGGVRNGVFDRLTTIDNGRLARAIAAEYDRLQPQAELAECGFSEPHEAHEYVVADEQGLPDDRPCPGLR